MAPAGAPTDAKSKCGVCRTTVVDSEGPPTASYAGGASGEGTRCAGVFVNFSMVDWSVSMIILRSSGGSAFKRTALIDF